MLAGEVDEGGAGVAVSASVALVRPSASVRQLVCVDITSIVLVAFYPLPSYLATISQPGVKGSSWI